MKLLFSSGVLAKKKRSQNISISRYFLFLQDFFSGYNREHILFLYLVFFYFKLIYPNAYSLFLPPEFRIGPIESKKSGWVDTVARVCHGVSAG